MLFYGPMNSLGDSCYCIIPSPEPGAAQGTSSIILALGVLFFPMGLMKGGLPTLRRGTGAAPPRAGVPGAAPGPTSPIASGRLFTIGLVLVLAGADAVAIPGYLVLRSYPVVLAGLVVAGLGVLALLLGYKRPKQG